MTDDYKQGYKDAYTDLFKEVIKIPKKKKLMLLLSRIMITSVWKRFV